MDITYRRKNRAPKYIDKQPNAIPIRARRLYRTLFSSNVELIINDEKYFLLHNESIFTNRDFCTSNTSATLPEVKFKAQMLV